MQDKRCVCSILAIQKQYNHCKRGVQSTARAYREKAQQSLSDDQVSQPLSGQNCERALVSLVLGQGVGFDDACAALRHPFVKNEKKKKKNASGKFRKCQSRSLLQAVPL